MTTFKTTRVLHNGKDQRIAGLFKINKPTSGRPYWELHYKAVGEKPVEVLYLSGNVKIVNTQQPIEKGGEEE